MSYIQESLSDNEKIEAEFEYHWFIWVPIALWFVAGIASFGILLPVAIYKLLVVKYTEMGLTNKRVIFKTGIVSRNTQEMKLTSIETVDLRQGIWGRMFGFGDINVTGRGISDLNLRSVMDPMGVKRQIESVSNPL